MDWKCFKDRVFKVGSFSCETGTRSFDAPVNRYGWVHLLSCFKCSDTLSSSAERLWEPFPLSSWLGKFYLKSYIVSVAVLAESLLEGYCLFLLRSWQERKKTKQEEIISGWYQNKSNKRHKPLMTAVSNSFHVLRQHVLDERVCFYDSANIIHHLECIGCFYFDDTHEFFELHVGNSLLQLRLW